MARPVYNGALGDTQARMIGGRGECMGQAADESTRQRYHTVFLKFTRGRLKTRVRTLSYTYSNGFISPLTFRDWGRRSEGEWLDKVGFFLAARLPRTVQNVKPAPDDVDGRSNVSPPLP